MATLEGKSCGMGASRPAAAGTGRWTLSPIPGNVSSRPLALRIEIWGIGSFALAAVPLSNVSATFTFVTHAAAVWLKYPFIALAYSALCMYGTSS